MLWLATACVVPVWVGPDHHLLIGQPGQCLTQLVLGGQLSVVDLTS
jgi:hypothetical protein